MCTEHSTPHYRRGRDWIIYLCPSLRQRRTIGRISSFYKPTLYTDLENTFPGQKYLIWTNFILSFFLSNLSFHILLWAKDTYPMEMVPQSSNEKWHHLVRGKSHDRIINFYHNYPSVLSIPFQITSYLLYRMVKLQEHLELCNFSHNIIFF